MLLKSRVNAARRAALMGSAAFAAIAVATPAQAQGSGASSGSAGGSVGRITDIDSTTLDPQAASDQLRAGGDVIRIREGLGDVSSLYPHAGTGVVGTVPVTVSEDPSITTNNNFTTTDIRDPVNITGIGQVVTDAGGGSVGLCTGTLINRRTIIYAAHCVNTRAATAYGANTGGVGIAVAFETNTRANAAGQTDELVRWLLGTGPNAEGRFQTNQAQALYNISQVFYNPASRAAASCTAPTSCFLEADIATAVLDTPTRNIPTWTTLFSPLPTVTTINPATGTGYHVTIAGYGNTGNGTTGITGSDFRRRTAENILGGLTSINNRNLFLFGTAGSPSRPQLLYWLDFDDPRRGLAGADAQDFNGFRDNALIREGLTGPGDSGGPLIIDQAFGQNVRTIIGVLSGGSSFTINGVTQQDGSYGTQSFYQPLFLYWDWIVANNPYRYVTAVAGNRNWEDPTTWLTELDPAYRVIVNGQLVNGLPTNLGGTNQVSNPQFGELCFQLPNSSPNPATNECVNLATGQARNNVPNSASDTGSPATVTLVSKEEAEGTGQSGGTGTDTAIAGIAGVDGVVDSAQADPGFIDTPRPAATLANGLPGATNFVANNSNGDRLTGVAARYYDVTLRNAGILTLGSGVTVDNFTIAGAQSQLTVAAAGSLTSLVEINQMTGIMNVNGTVRSLGDYFLMSGLLSGTGRVNAPFLTSVIGNIAPGTNGTIGTLTIGGNLVLSSGNSFLIDIGPSGTSDRLVVVADSGSAGTATLGGRVILTPVAGTFLNRRNTGPFTILTAEGGVTGTFLNNPTAISAILQQRYLYTANTVRVQIEALPYVSVVDITNPNRFAFARLLDQNANVAALTGIYDVLDLVPTAAQLNTILDSLSPRTESLRTGMAVALVDNQSQAIRGRLGELRQGDLGGRFAYYGRRVQTAALSLSGLAGAEATMSDISVQPPESVGRLPETMSGFLSVGYLDGDSRAQVGSAGSGRDSFDGFFGMAGLEKEMGDRAVLGAAISYSNAEGSTFAGGGEVETSLIQGSLYGKTGLGGRAYLDGQLSLGMLDFNGSRPGSLPGSTTTLSFDDNALAFAGEVGVGTFIGDDIQIGPRVSLRYSQINFDDIDETGGLLALTIDREEYRSIEGRAGLVLTGGRGPFRPHVSATYVHNFEDPETSFGANFIGGTGAPVLFGLAGNDTDWTELSGTLAYDFGRLELSLSADATVGRESVNNTAVRFGVKFSF